MIKYGTNISWGPRKCVVCQKRIKCAEVKRKHEVVNVGKMNITVNLLNIIGKKFCT
jgi:phosphoribosyl-dephospho-CoA transferase